MSSKKFSRAFTILLAMTKTKSLVAQGNCITLSTVHEAMHEFIMFVLFLARFF